MKQRLAIAAAMLGNPEVLILDEPTNGLDPRGIADIRDLIIRIANTGITIILASHLLDEVEKVCTHVAVLDHGKKLFSGAVDEVLSGKATLELAATDMALLENTLSGQPWVLGLKKEGQWLALHLADDFDPAGVNKYLSQKDIYLTHLAVRNKTLEKYFLELLSENHDSTH